MPHTFLFEDDELDELTCAQCGGPFVIYGPVRNDDGDLIEFACCPLHQPTPDKPDERTIVVPRSASRPRA
jgi:hypothetical protein